MIFSLFLVSVLLFAGTAFLKLQKSFGSACLMLGLSFFLLFSNQDRVLEFLPAITISASLCYFLTHCVFYYFSPRKAQNFDYILASIIYLSSLWFCKNEALLSLGTLTFLLVFPELFHFFAAKKESSSSGKAESQSTEGKEGHFYLIEDQNEVIVLFKRPLPYLMTVFCFMLSFGSFYALFMILRDIWIWASAIKAFEWFLLIRIISFLVLFPILLFSIAVFFTIPIIRNYTLSKIIGQKNSGFSSCIMIGSKEIFKKNYPYTEISNLGIVGTTLFLFLKDESSIVLIKGGLGVGTRNLEKAKVKLRKLLS